MICDIGIDIDCAKAPDGKRSLNVEIQKGVFHTFVRRIFNNANLFQFSSVVVATTSVFMQQKDKMWWGFFAAIL